MPHYCARRCPALSTDMLQPLPFIPDHPVLIFSFGICAVLEIMKTSGSWLPPELGRELGPEHKVVAIWNVRTGQPNGHDQNWFQKGLLHGILVLSAMWTVSQDTSIPQNDRGGWIAHWEGTFLKNPIHPKFIARSLWFIRHFQGTRKSEF